jgi:O-succinylbenzoic acid--CoA ligase
MGNIIVPVSTRWPPDLITKSLIAINCQTLIILDERLKIKKAPEVRFLLIDELSGSTDKPVDRSPQKSQLKGPAQISSILFTSGSTGQSKAAVHSFANHYYSAVGSQANIPLVPEDSWLLSLPLYHIGGLAILVRALIAGSAVFIPDRNIPLEETLTIAEVTHLSLVSTQLERLMQSQLYLNRLEKLKAILVGGGPIPHKLIDRTFESGLPVYTSYGSTEMSSQITTTGYSDTLSHLRTAGKVLPYREVHLAEDNEVWVRGKTLFLGYLENGNINLRLNEDGWFPTGDIGDLDDDGYLRITGRKDNQFISGGENIQPEEIEQVLRQFSGISEAIVVPVNHPEFGKRPVAFVKIKDQRSKIKESHQNKKSTNNLSDVLEREIREYLAERLPRFKIPDRFFLWPEEERLEHGLKISRRGFQDLASKYLNN